VSERTYYRWRREDGSMGIEWDKRLKQLEQEESHLEGVVANLSVDSVMLSQLPTSGTRGHS
jgi:hypothetical protein